MRSGGRQICPVRVRSHLTRFSAFYYSPAYL